MVRLAGSTLTYSRLPLPDALRGLARLGFAEVELAALEGWAHVSPARLAEQPQVASEVASLVDGAGMPVVAVNAGLGTGDMGLQRDRLSALGRLAKTLGARVVTIPAGKALDAGEVARLGALVEAIEPSGVTLAVECHMGALTETPAVAEEVCRAVPGLRLTLDPSHYWAGPAQGRGWEAVLPYVAHVHVRDAGCGGWNEIQVAPGLGRVDFLAVVAALGSAGYTGVYAEEYIDSLPVSGGVTAEEAAATIARMAQGWGV